MVKLLALNICQSDMLSFQRKELVAVWENYSDTHNFMLHMYVYMSRVYRKLAFCIYENKDVDQLRGNHEADQRLCFRYIDSTIPLLSNYFLLSSL